MNGALHSDFILSKLADYISEIGKFPTSGDLRMKARSDKDFPSHNTFNRYSGKSGLAEALHLYCSRNDRLDLIKYCEPFLTDKIEARSSNSKIEENGSVYLYKSGKH